MQEIKPIEPTPYSSGLNVQLPKCDAGYRLEKSICVQVWADHQIIIYHIGISALTFLGLMLGSAFATWISKK